MAGKLPPKDTATRSPEELRTVFGRNLRLMASKSPSISQLCRDIGVNRTQFNRYLAGDAFPRPDVLDRICQHFGRDARILLEPLERLDREAPRWPLAGLDLSPLSTQAQNFDHERIPDGLYRFMVRSLIDVGRSIIMLVRLSRLPDGSKSIDWSISREFARLAGMSDAWTSRRSTGLVFQHTDGISVVMASHYSRSLRFAYFSYGHRGMNNIHTGFCCGTHRRANEQRQVQPALLQQVRPTCADIIAARRSCGQYVDEEMPEIARGYFQSWVE